MEGLEIVLWAGLVTVLCVDYGAFLREISGFIMTKVCLGYV
jgi:hypothetical protein